MISTSQALLVQMGGVEQVIATMQAHSQSMMTQKYACNLLQLLCVDAEAAADSNIQVSCSFLFSLSLLLIINLKCMCADHLQDMIGSLGGVDAMFNVLRVRLLHNDDVRAAAADAEAQQQAEQAASASCKALRVVMHKHDVNQVRITPSHSNFIFLNFVLSLCFYQF
jgi:hypothetical protein